MEWNLYDDGPAAALPAYRLVEEFDEMLDIDDEPCDPPIEDDDCGDAGELAQITARRFGD